MSNKDFKVKRGIQPTVYHEAVGTVVSGNVGYGFGSVSYDNVSFSVTSQDTSPLDMVFNNDGTKMYMMGTQNDSIYQYTLSTAYDLSTASYDSVSFSVAGQSADPMEIAINNDGTKMYLLSGYLANRYVYQYSLSTAFDLSTISYDSVSFDIASQANNPSSVTFNNDGTKMYICCYSNDEIYQYTLSTAFDLTTASYASVSLDVSSQDATPFGLSFNNDGTKMYLVGRTNDTIYEYTLSTAFDISTASYNNVSFYVGNEDAVPSSITFNSSGTKMYITGFINDEVYQYSTALTTAELDLSTGSVFEITPTSDIQVTLTNPAASGTSSGATLLLDQQGYGGYDVANGSYDNISLSIAGQETQGQGLTFKSDGTKLYVIGTNGDDVNEYDLSTAWNVSTATYLQNFSVSAQESNPTDITFKVDGTEMYVVGSAGDSVYQYILSSAWDISTASYTRAFSVATQEIAPAGVFFKTDGTKMYIVGYSGDDVNEYNLSTAWNISTASFLQLFSVASQEANPQSLAFSSDGTKMFVLGENGLDVNYYSLSTAWNVSTASFSSAFTLTASEVAVRGLAFSNDGSKMYILDEDDETIHQYSTATPATITYPSTLQWSGGTAPTSPAIGETDVLTFNTTDGGTTYQAVQAISGAS
jgi:sugar lactone lactonase YvrE